MIFGVPMGCDFVEEAVKGLLRRHHDPLELSKVTLIVNSGRFGARLGEKLGKFADLSPKILTMDGAIDYFYSEYPVPNKTQVATDVLDLANLLAKLAASSELPIFNTNARFEIAYSLLDLLNQTVERGLEPNALNQLDVGDFAQHWQLNSKFFSVLSQYWQNAQSQSQLYHNLERIAQLSNAWEETPHLHPVYIIGSTGSRPIMRKLMQTVLKLPKSGIVLPSFDFEVEENLPADHPQFGNLDLCQWLGQEKVGNWHGEERPIAKFIQLALAPAPVTDRWRKQLEDVKKWVDDDPMQLYFIEAKNRYEEANSLSLLIHDMTSMGKSVSFVSADRQLARLLAHRLEALGISYDDSSGTPMAMSVTGRLLNMILEYSNSPEPTGLIPLLSHPYVALDDRQNHLRQLRALEEKVLRKYPGLNPWQPRFFAENPDFQAWASSLQAKINWDHHGERSLNEWLIWHQKCFHDLVGIDHAEISSRLNNGLHNESEIFSKMEQLGSAQAHSQLLSFQEYGCFWNAWISREKAIPAQINHNPQVRILGAIESRAESADVIIQAGMNEGQWPSPSIPDMWLNRKLRSDLGLETPERFVGLAAHDFISGLACQHWVLSRSKQNDGAPTVESRFLTRLKTLLKGANGLAFDRANFRGDEIVNRARRLNLPETMSAPTSRPSVKLPLDARPLKLSVTNIEKYVQNPYRFFVEKVLGLRALNPISSELQHNVIGEIWHAFFENMTHKFDIHHEINQDLLHEVFHATYSSFEPNRMECFKFEYEFEKMKTEFILGEKARRAWAEEILPELNKSFIAKFEGYDVELIAKIDRIDVSSLDDWRVYDYKSGASAPFNAAKLNFIQTQQLPLTAYILEHSGFGGKCEGLGVIRYRPKDKASSIEAIYDGANFEVELAQMFQGYFDENKIWELNTKDQHIDGVLHFARFGEWLPFQASKTLVIEP